MILLMCPEAVLRPIIDRCKRWRYILTNDGVNLGMAGVIPDKYEWCKSYRKCGKVECQKLRKLLMDVFWHTY